jgi:ribose transport system substrate-binding protein/ribose transport system permease protein
VSLAALTAVCLAAVSGCVSTGASAAGGKKLIYFIYNGPTPPYFAPMASGIIAANKKYPNLDIKTVNANASSSTEISDIDAAVAAGAQGIILNAIDGSVTQAALTATHKGIPVVTIDRDVNTPKARFAFIGDDDFKLGEQETSSCLQGLQTAGMPKPWHVVVLEGTLGASTAVDRLNGSLAELKPDEADGSVQVVLNQSANFDTGTAQTLMSSFLARTTNIQAVISGNDAMAIGVLTALQSRGIQAGKKTLVCGVDAQPQDLTDIQNGTQYNTVTHAPYLEAFWSVEAMNDYLTNHTKPPASDPNGDVLVPQVVVTKANLSSVAAWGTPSTIPPLPYGSSK